MNDFFRRTITAAGIVVFILGGFWLHPVSFFITGLVIMTGAMVEYYRAVRTTGMNPRICEGIFTGILLYSVSTLVAAQLADNRYFLLIPAAAAVIMAASLFRKEEKPFDVLAHTLFAVIYISVPFSLFPWAGFMKEGVDSLLPHGTTGFSPGLIIGFFLILWANDTGAYLVGIAIGRHRLMERISPRKSWEGFFGGALTAILASWLLSKWLGVVGTGSWIIVGAIIVVAGTFGDLIESMLKRSTGIKDTGSIMPGHGGFLDRFDSTVISFPLVYLFIALFG